MAVNRNKRSLALDLKTPEALRIVGELVQTYEVVLEQSRPGAMKRLGLDYESLKQKNERLIYCSITGYGQNGPYRDRAGHDLNYLATAGVLSYSGRAGQGPVPQGFVLADVGGGSYNAVVSILAALLHRSRTGEGQYLDVSMTDGAVGWQTFMATHYLAGGEDPDYEADFLNGGSHYDCYRTLDGRYMSVGSLEPRFFKELCRGLGREDWVSRQPWGMTPDDHIRDMKKEMAALFATKTMAEWTEIFGALDACVEPVLKISEMVEHPQVKARGMVTGVPKKGGGHQRQINSPFKFSKTETEMRWTGPSLGEHSDEILMQIGYAEEEIRNLKQKGVVG
jgi:crotonobetainyl-CoA:carnitine CoA-transferase CaiB-like acyl-CoA transferase